MHPTTRPENESTRKTRVMGVLHRHPKRTAVSVSVAVYLAIGITLLEVDELTYWTKFATFAVAMSLYKVLRHKDRRIAFKQPRIAKHLATDA